MPKFNDENLENYSNQGTGHYGFSAVKIEDLEASEYTLVTVVLDESGSTGKFRSEMEACIKEIVKACRESPRADFLLLRMVVFATRMSEIHGFMPLEQCNPDNYNGCYGNNGNGASTSLYDSSENAIKSSLVYAKELADQDFDVNGLVVIITDGDDNECKSGNQGRVLVKEALESCLTSETMESLVSILVGVNVQQTHLAKYLDDFYQEAGFSQYVKLEDADAKTLAKLADFVSRSISSQSQALGSGGPSQSLTF